MVSNTLLLFFAGLENGASNMAITCWLLAKNPDIQERLYQEVQEAIANNSGITSQHLDYNYLQNNMPYLEGMANINQSNLLAHHMGQMQGTDGAKNGSEAEEHQATTPSLRALR